MKNKIKGAFVITMLGAISAPAFAQTSSVTTTGSTTIIQPVTIAENSGLAFGTIVRPLTGSSTVTIGTGADTVSVTGNALVRGGTTSRARYTVTGEGAETVTVTAPGSFNLSKAGATDLAVTLTRNPTGNLTLNSTAGSQGTASLDIGGSFAITSTTTTGVYTGTYAVSVAYN